MKLFLRTGLAAVLVLVLGFGAMLAADGWAAPVAPDQQSRVAYQSIPDWMPAETASNFDIGIDVLVPFSLPAPFSGMPQYSASDGYYSLYWYVGGGSPTLLQVIGQAGGSIPDYSKYDRNVELTANATVQGVTAYSDVTPVYDLVYWEVGGVVYSVESQNSSLDSITLANSLGVLSVPDTSVPEEPDSPSASISSPDQIAGGDTGTVTVSTDYDVVVSTDVGTFDATGTNTISLSGGDTLNWTAPVVDSDVTATFTVTSAADGTYLASTPTLVQAQVESSTTSDIAWELSCPEVALAGSVATITASGPSFATVSTANGTFAGGSPAVGLDLGGSVDLDFNVPDDGSESVTLNLLDGSSAVATCTIAITYDADAAEVTPTPEPTELPTGAFPGDGTDLSVGTGSFPTVPADVGTATPQPTTDPALIEGDGTGIMEATKIIVPTVPDTPTPTKTPRPGDPTFTPIPTETPVPTRTATPENPIPTMVPQITNDSDLAALVIGPVGGVLTCPFGVQVAVPEGALTDETSVTVQPVPDSQLTIQQTVRYVPESAYDLAFAQMDGRGITLGEKSARVTIDLQDRFAEGATVYQLNDGVPTRIEGVEVKGTTLSFDTSGPMQFVAGVPVQATAAQSRNLVPLIVLALLAVIVMIVAITVLTSLRSKKAPTISNRGSRKRSRF